MKETKENKVVLENAITRDEELRALAQEIFASELAKLSSLTIREQITHNDGKVEVNKVKVVQDPDIIRAKVGFTLVDVITKIFVEKANSRQIRYELFVDKERTKPHLEFKRAVHTLAFLASLPNSDTKIEIVDEFGFTTQYTPKQYSVPNGILYNVVNFSNKVYLNEISRGLRKWLTKTVVETGHEDSLLMTPGELETFLKHFDSNAKDNEKWNTTPLDKKEIALSSLAFVRSQVSPESVEFKLHKFKGDSEEGMVKLYVTVLRGIECDTLKDHAMEVTPITVTDYIHNAVYGIENPQ